MISKKELGQQLVGLRQQKAVWEAKVQEAHSGMERVEGAIQLAEFLIAKCDERAAQFVGVESEAAA